ncbi:MAG: hypothetical protein NTZ40_13565 [Cyanobacteria bacterium]|nr:hypothetical protein [Cyanobacteriota bacterium]
MVKAHRLLCSFGLWAAGNHRLRARPGPWGLDALARSVSRRGCAGGAPLDPASRRAEACLPRRPALAPLAEQGWLIVASGDITNNLGNWQQTRRSGGVDTSYAQRFSGWVAE